LVPISGAKAFDDALYPDWAAAGTGSAPAISIHQSREVSATSSLTPEYQKILEASVADQRARGGQGNDPGYRCNIHGMPRIMNGVLPIQFLVLPETTYVMPELSSILRRIYTDGRDWPERLPRSPTGYSIGRWLDTDGDGRYDTLVAETRGMKTRAVTTAAAPPSIRMSRQS
jgi:hypothetical protein